MRSTILILFVLLSLSASAQRINGIVLDKKTDQPIPGAVVKTAKTIQATTSNGNFTLVNIRPTDTVRVTIIGYNVLYFTPGASRDTLRIFMTQNNIFLQNVDIVGKHDRRIDSAQNRREFARYFFYTAPTLMDAFDRVDPYPKVLSSFNESANNMTQIVNLDLLSVSSLFGKNNTPQAKLSRLVKQDENISYIDSRFTKEKVSSLTGLHGDELADFMNTYRPNIGVIKRMSDYDLMVYIKKSFAEYKHNKKAPVNKI